MVDLQDQHVLVLGLGASGLSMARWCVRQGARVTVADTRVQPPQLAALRAQVPQADFVHTAFSAALVDGTSVRAVFASPGLSPAQTQATLDAARAAGLWVGSELALFAQALVDLRQQARYEPTVLAVTGTNGKTTVTALTGHLVRWAGKTAAVAGNIGPPLLETLLQALDDAALPQFWVLELSSFQLDLPCAFEPTAATVLNVTQDHLDWHGSLQNYAQAKSRIFGGGLMVLNRDDPQVMAMLPAPTRNRQQRPVARDYLAYGTDLPQRPGDFGLEEVHGMCWLVRALPSEEARQGRAPQAQELHIQRLIPADALRIRGRHNACNALAALALCAAAGLPLGPILFGLREYRGEPHRVQSIGILHGIEYFDDSKGTNVGATVAALHGLGSDRRLVVILGGEGKGQDFAPLAAPVARYARAAVLIGRDAALIGQAIAPAQVPLLDAHGMDEAVNQATRLARPGDAVLLSPACASFDMFEDYAHRARAFVAAVQALALASGVELELTA